MAGDPRFPDHTDEFKRIMDRSTVHPGVVEGNVRVLELEVSDLMNVRDDELVLLSRFGGVTNMPVEAEIARRNIAATRNSTQAIQDLQTSVDTLHQTTQAASVTTREAIGELKTGIGELNTGIHGLRVSADRWSRRITLLTVGLFALTVGLLAVAVGQVWR